MFTIENIKGHYNLYWNGEFIGSADNYAELDELKREWITALPIDQTGYVLF